MILGSIGIMVFSVIMGLGIAFLMPGSKPKKLEPTVKGHPYRQAQEVPFNMKDFYPPTRFGPAPPRPLPPPVSSPQ